MQLFLVLRTRKGNIGLRPIRVPEARCRMPNPHRNIIVSWSSRPSTQSLGGGVEEEKSSPRRSRYRRGVMRCCPELLPHIFSSYPNMDGRGHCHPSLSEEAQRPSVHIADSAMAVVVVVVTTQCHTVAGWATSCDRTSRRPTSAHRWNHPSCHWSSSHSLG
uniref:Uncharacterized protein n=1 Tax=Attheya septentrionalis TaxID=420275 RepID=A0A7S2XHS8_9STRA|mmetsp:Transcript_10108/g.18414  ORF Transcript_10108/g.18414 Transcript_10108/m.18414 type:complete len:161 (+) Transcript_10108:49-531(+)